MINWAKHLQRWGLSEPMAAFLEATGPLSVLLAQFVYFAQPFLAGMLSLQQWKAVIGVFEDTATRAEFIDCLRQERLT